MPTNFDYGYRFSTDHLLKKLPGADLTVKGLDHGAGDGVTGINSVLNWRLALT